MSEARQNLWVTLAILAVVVIVATITETLPLTSTAVVAEVSRPPLAADETAVAARQETQAPDLDAQVARFCAAHRDALTRAEQLDLEPADDTDSVVRAALQQLVAVTEVVVAELDPDTFDAEVHGDRLHEQLVPLRDTVDTVGSTARQLLDDDADAAVREAFLLAQFDDASYLEPLNVDPELAVAVVASSECADLPWQPRR